MITFLIRRGVPVALLASMIAVLVWRATMPATVEDVWFHLRLGQEFLDGWALGSPGHLGTFDSADWVPTQWAPQIAMSFAADRWGLGIVLWTYTALAIIVTVGIYWVCRQHSPALAAVLVTSVAWFALLPSLSERPQVLSYLLFLVLVTTWHRQTRDGRARWWLVPMVWVWVPLHGMWIIGLATIAVMSVGTWMDHRASARAALPMMLVPPSAALAALLTPIGFGAYRSVFGVGGRAEYFAEWSHPNLLQGNNLGLVVLFAVVIVAWTRGPRVSWSLLAMLALAAAFALYSARTVPFAVLLLAPLAAAVLRPFLPSADVPQRAERATLALIPVAALALLAFLLPSRLTEAPAPAWVDDRLSGLAAGTPVLTTWDSGTYFLWAHPQIDIVMHGYGDVFTDEEIERNRILATVAGGWRHELDELGVRYAVVDTGSRLADALLEDTDWRVIMKDEDFVLLEPPAA